MTKTEYFLHGMADASSKQYALFSDYFNRFMVIDDDLMDLQITSCVFSSRYPLIIYELTTANNFHSISKIDNSICFNWRPNQSVSYMYVHKPYDPFSTPIFKCDLLEEDALALDDLIINDIKYIWLIMYTIKKYLKGQQNDLHYLGHRSNFLPLIMEDRQTQVTKKIYNIFFNEFRYDVANSLIKKLITEYEY